jgi:type VI secretion system VasD/TssJ family lipoprotein
VTRVSFGAVVLAAAGALALGGCGSTCVAEGDRLVVDLVGSQDMNDAGEGPQHVRFRVWAVRDAAIFQGADASALAEADPAVLERQGMGRPFATDASFLRPGGTRLLYETVAEDGQYTHVGVAVLYPQPRKELVPLDCRTRPGYRAAKPEHRVSFVLDRSTVRPGEAQPRSAP